eukprot:INCI13490.20.p1 GENE.INCI13490.20~~INCI13490.20.p1  ORF type:complete len:122 (+),score=6.77 INCI13490.20:92-457(+)
MQPLTLRYKPVQSLRIHDGGRQDSWMSCHRFAVEAVVAAEAESSPHSIRRPEKKCSTAASVLHSSCGGNLTTRVQENITDLGCRVSWLLRHICALHKNVQESIPNDTKIPSDGLHGLHSND